MLDLRWNDSSTIGMGKTQKSEELKGFHDFSVPQASIQEAVILYDGAVCFDGHDEFKGKDRHDTDGSLSLGLGRLPDGWTSPSVSTT